MKTVWVFPGQGSQMQGMGADLADSKQFAQAEELLGWSVAEVCQSGQETLTRTDLTQPCLYVISAVLADLLKAQGHRPDFVAGHSLGEYAALYCGGAFDFVTGLKLVQKRSLLMAQVHGGKMAALMGFDRQKLELVVDQHQDVVIANDNSADQVVISGTSEAVAQVIAELNAKRSVYLPVSGAFHSPLMQSVAVEFNHYLDQFTFQDLTVPFLSNVHPLSSTQSGQVCHTSLSQQMTAPVRWRELCLHLQELGCTRVVEVGAGKVLTGLVKRILPGVELINISNRSDIFARLS
ncbi:MAG: [acyl-carrier-protein] S-malonyltransferase [Cyanobacteria bacterium M5B4]|nr:MAG: [acyl-carrier-protein] S-malonyltransferase [Cyanobacteria bacterium M5B4]